MEIKQHSHGIYMRDWFKNDIFEFETEDVKSKHEKLETPSLEELIKKCKAQVNKYGTCNDTGKFCFDMLYYLNELKDLRSMGKTMDNYEYKDSSVYVKSNGKFRGKEYGRKWKCPICHDYIGEEENVCMILNNFKYFPNTLVHEECFMENDSEQVFTEIENKYKTLKEIEDMF